MVQIKMYVPKYDDKTRSEKIENHKKEKQELINKYLSNRNNQGTSVLKEESNLSDTKIYFQNEIKHCKNELKNEKKLNNELKNKIYDKDRTIKILNDKYNSYRMKYIELENILKTNVEDNDYKNFKINELKNIIINLRTELKSITKEKEIETKNINSYKEKTDYYQYTVFKKPFEAMIKGLQRQNQQLMNLNNELSSKYQELVGNNNYLSNKYYESQCNFCELKKKYNNLNNFLKNMLYSVLLFRHDFQLVLKTDIECEGDNFVSEYVYGIAEYDKSLKEYVFSYKDKKYIIINKRKIPLSYEKNICAYIDNEQYAHVIGVY